MSATPLPFFSERAHSKTVHAAAGVHPFTKTLERSANVSLCCGSGLTLGISSTITNNLYSRMVPNAGEGKLLFNRLSIIVVLLLAVLFTAGDLQSVSFMSTGLRGAVIFLLPRAALFLLSSNLGNRIFETATQAAQAGEAFSTHYVANGSPLEYKIGYYRSDVYFFYLQQSFNTKA